MKHPYHDAQRIVDAYLLKLTGKPVVCPVVLSRRGTVRMGATRVHAVAPNKYRYEIILELKVLELVDTPEYEETLRHEAAHIANYVLNHEFGHGKRWIALACVIGGNGQRHYPAHVYQLVRTAYPKRRPVRHAGPAYLWRRK